MKMPDGNFEYLGRFLPLILEWAFPVLFTGLIVYVLMVGKFNLRGNYVYLDKRPGAFTALLALFACIDALAIYIACNDAWPQAFR